MKDRIQTIEINMTKLNGSIDAIKDALVDNKSEHREIILKIDSFIQSADNRFAAKAEHKETLQKVKDLSQTIDDKYVTKESFGLIQKIVYGMVGAILVSFLSALLLLVFNKAI